MKAISRSVWRCIALRFLRVRTSYYPATEARLRNGGTIVCANHVSFVDGLIIALASPVHLTFAVHTDFSRHSRAA